MEAEAPILWPPDVKSWLSGKDLDAGEDWGQEEKEVTQDEMVVWHHWFNGHEFEQTLGVGEGQWSLVCCSPWGHKESDTTEWLNKNNTSTELKQTNFQGLKTYGKRLKSLSESCMSFHLNGPSVQQVKATAERAPVFTGRHVLRALRLHSSTFYLKQPSLLF